MHSGIFVDCISPERKKSIFRFGRKQVDVGNARRDQPDQRLHLTRNMEKLSWDLDHAETELWKKPPDPFLKKVAGILTVAAPEWNGSATELAALLQEEMQPNILTRQLNVKAGELLSEYGVEYTVKRTRNGSAIRLRNQEV